MGEANDPGLSATNEKHEQASLRRDLQAGAAAFLIVIAVLTTVFSITGFFRHVSDICMHDSASRVPAGTKMAGPPVIGLRKMGTQVACRYNRIDISGGNTRAVEVLVPTKLIPTAFVVFAIDLGLIGAAIFLYRRSKASSS